jgi:tetratricopeptide (TPR) repeat protein
VEEALGLEWLRQEQWDKAQHTLENALRLAERTGDERAILLARLHLGRAANGAGYLDRAADLLQPLPDAFLALDEPDRYHRGRALTSLGEVCLRRGLPEVAINFFGQALELMRAERASAGAADAWTHLAEAARLRSDPEAERAALTEAHAAYEALGVPEAERVAARLQELSA